MPCFFHMRIARKRRRLALAEVGEDQTEVFPSRTASYADLCRERFFFRGLLDALTGGIEHQP